MRNYAHNYTRIQNNLFGERIRRRLVHESFKLLLLFLFEHNNEFEREQYHETIKYNPKLASHLHPVSHAHTHDRSMITFS